MVIDDVLCVCTCSCTFEGTKEELRTHLEQCKFEGLKVRGCLPYSTKFLSCNFFFSVFRGLTSNLENFVRVNVHICTIRGDIYGIPQKNYAQFFWEIL